MFRSKFQQMQNGQEQGAATGQNPVRHTPMQLPAPSTGHVPPLARPGFLMPITPPPEGLFTGWPGPTSQLHVVPFDNDTQNTGTFGRFNRDLAQAEASRVSHLSEANRAFTNTRVNNSAAANMSWTASNNVNFTRTLTIPYAMTTGADVQALGHLRSAAPSIGTLASSAQLEGRARPEIQTAQWLHNLQEQNEQTKGEYEAEEEEDLDEEDCRPESKRSTSGGKLERGPHPGYVLDTQEAQNHLHSQLAQADANKVQQWITLVQQANHTLLSRNRGRKQVTAATAPFAQQIETLEATMSAVDKAVAMTKILGDLDFNGTIGQVIRKSELTLIFGKQAASGTSKRADNCLADLYGKKVIIKFKEARKKYKTGDGPSNAAEVEKFEQEGRKLPDHITSKRNASRTQSQQGPPVKKIKIDE